MPQGVSKERPTAAALNSKHRAKTGKTALNRGANAIRLPERTLSGLTEEAVPIRVLTFEKEREQVKQALVEWMVMFVDKTYNSTPHESPALPKESGESHTRERILVSDPVGYRPIFEQNIYNSLGDTTRTILRVMDCATKRTCGHSKPTYETCRNNLFFLVETTEVLLRSDLMNSRSHLGSCGDFSCAFTKSFAMCLTGLNSEDEMIRVLNEGSSTDSSALQRLFDLQDICEHQNMRVHCLDGVLARWFDWYYPDYEEPGFQAYEKLTNGRKTNYWCDIAHPDGGPRLVGVHERAGFV